jgi:copper chaperone NosL
MMKHTATHDPAAELQRDGHVHLRAAPARVSPAARHGWRRPAVVAAAVLSAALFGLAFFLPWWRFVLYAPQYPSGLRLTIALTGVGGDVREIDMINHYIGMHSLSDAAHLERQMAAYGVAAVAVIVVAATMLAGKRLNRLVAVPGLAFPLLFLADSFYWLYRFGHQLDPKAPLRIAPFTPQFFGNGQIGQFLTFAAPASGFWVAVAAAVLLVIAVIVRGRVCASCPSAGSCGVVCPTAFVRPPREVQP